MRFAIVDNETHYGLALKRLSVTIAGLETTIDKGDDLKEVQSKIGNTVSTYFSEEFFDKIPDRANPGVTYVTYSKYSSNYHGSYNFLIGEVCRSTTIDLPNITIPSEDCFYLKITTDKGKVSDVVQKAWNYIWESEENGKLSEKICELKEVKAPYAKRKYGVDFEIYDHRASNPDNSEVDIYIGFEYSDSLE